MRQYASNDLFIDEEQGLYPDMIQARNASQRFLFVLLFFYFIGISYFLYWCFS